MIAKDVMTTKLITIHPETTLREITQLLLDHHISGLPVVDGQGGLVGIVSEGDLMYKEVTTQSPAVLNIIGALIHSDGVQEYRETAGNLLELTAADIMTTDVISFSPNTGLQRIGRIMLENHIKRVPIVEGNKLVGIVSRADVIRPLLKQG